jgi:Na+/proline symporter
MYWLNPLAYTLYALIVTQLGDLTDTFVEFNGEMISVPQLLEDRFGYKYSFRWPATVILIAFLLVFRMASIAAIKVLNFQVGTGPPPTLPSTLAAAGAAGSCPHALC